MPFPAGVTTPFSMRFRSTLSLINQQEAADLATLWGHPEFSSVYPRLLEELYHVSKGATALMDFVRTKAQFEGDPSSTLVAEYLEKHVEEERGHCEWLLDDLEVLGFRRQDITAKPPTRFSTAILGCAYAWAAEHHPATILGHLAVFEGNPFPVEFLESKIAASGLPKAAFGFYLDHARLDPHHAADIFGLMDRLPLSPKQEEEILLCALHTQFHTHNLLRTLVDSSALPSRSLS